MVAALIWWGLGRGGSLILGVRGSGECEMVAFVRFGPPVVSRVLVLFRVPAYVRVILTIGF